MYKILKYLFMPGDLHFIFILVFILAACALQNYMSPIKCVLCGNIATFYTTKMYKYVKSSSKNFNGHEYRSSIYQSMVQ